MSKKNHTEISELGRFAFIERICAGTTSANPSTVKGCGDDAAVIDTGDRYTLLSTKMLLEGVNFDLTYFPLKHLGYKAVTAGVSDILAMNGRSRQVAVSLGVSARFSVEMIEEFYEGVRAACTDYGADLVGCDTAASVNGLAISVSAVGEVEKDRVTYRSGAGLHDLVCLTGDLGAAYMGLHLLEREKRALDGHPDPEPKFEGHEYILGRYLRPRARIDVVENLAKNGIVPTSMTDITDGLSSDLLHLCKNSDMGTRIYLDRLPIAKQTYEMAEELRTDPVVAALNGGEDYELLFTVPVGRRDEIFSLGIDVIGHIAPRSAGVALVTPDGGELKITAPGWNSQSE